MKLTILAENLQKTVGFVTHAVSSKSQLPILLNFLLVAKGGSLRITATDLEIGIQGEVAASIEEEGETTVPAKTFAELVASLPTDKITLSLEEGQLHFVTKKIKSTFQVVDPAEFPKLYEEKGEALAGVSVTKKDLSSVVFAASIDSSRPALSGVLLQKEEDGIFLVATDGFRLSLRSLVTGKSTAETALSLVIPARVIREVIAFKEGDESVTISVSEKQNQVFFTQAATLIIGRLIEEKFPNYKKIIPGSHTTKVVFEREELLKAVRVCAIFAKDAANIVKLVIQKEKITASSSSTIGQNQVEVASTLEGEESEISFNARYLLDVLSHIEDEYMVFEMTGPLAPGVFKLKDDPSFLHLIMPIRVQND